MTNEWQTIDKAPRDNKRKLYLCIFANGAIDVLDRSGEYVDGMWDGLSYFGPGTDAPTHFAYQDEPIPLTPRSREEKESGLPLLKEQLERAYLAGFNASGEGYNGEYPFGGPEEYSPESHELWIEDRNEYVKEALEERADSTKPVAEPESAAGLHNIPAGWRLVPVDLLAEAAKLIKASEFPGSLMGQAFNCAEALSTATRDFRPEGLAVDK